MTIRIVQLGTARAKDEGTRIGTVRRPPRGVPKEKFASQNWYDVWYPNLAPSVEAMKQAQAADTPASWAAFVKKFRAEKWDDSAGSSDQSEQDIKLDSGELNGVIGDLDLAGLCIDADVSCG